MDQQGVTRTEHWDERTWAGQPADGAGLPRRTVAEVQVLWEGPVEGRGEQRWLMTYDGEGLARFVGLEHLVGTWGGRQGSCVLQHRGRFETDGLTSDWEVVPGSGTDGWAGVGGHGSLRNPGDSPTTTWTAELRLPG